jgi:hypothetical protein
MEKETILKKYAELKASLGRPPSAREFQKVVSKRQIEKSFGANAYTKLVSEAGDEPSIPFHLKEDKWTPETMYEAYGNAVRLFGHRPTMAEWNHQRLRPSVAYFTLKLGNWIEDVPKAFLTYGAGKAEWQDVVRIIQPTEAVPATEDLASPSGGDGLADFLPPALSRLVELSEKDSAGGAFEKQVNLAFQVLGFSVQALGQGTGRNSDGIAVDAGNHYAIFLDAKSRQEGYGLGTDDRAFIEYVRARENELRRRGISHLYLCVVSSRFKGSAQRAIDNIKRETGVSSVVLLPAKLLTDLVASHVKYPAAFDLSKFKELFVRDGEMTAKVVAQWNEQIASHYQTL